MKINRDKNNPPADKRTTALVLPGALCLLASLAGAETLSDPLLWVLRVAAVALLGAALWFQRRADKAGQDRDAGPGKGDGDENPHS